jgi:hypothetical protein
MIDRLATLHRNELMRAEAVLSNEELAILFAPNAGSHDCGCGEAEMCANRGFPDFE